MNLSDLTPEAQDYITFEISLLPSLESREEEFTQAVLSEMEKPLWDIMADWNGALQNIKTPYYRPVDRVWWYDMPDARHVHVKHVDSFKYFRDSRAAQELFPLHVARIAYKARVIIVSGDNGQNERATRKIERAPRSVRDKLLRPRSKKADARTSRRSGPAL